MFFVFAWELFYDIKLLGCASTLVRQNVLKLFCMDFDFSPGGAMHKNSFFMFLLQNSMHNLYKEIDDSEEDNRDTSSIVFSPQKVSSEGNFRYKPDTDSSLLSDNLILALFPQFLNLIETEVKSDAGCASLGKSLGSSQLLKLTPSRKIRPMTQPLQTELVPIQWPWCNRN